MLNARGRIDRTFKHIGNRGIHNVRIGPFECGGNRNDRKLDIRVAIHPDPVVADDAEQDEHGAQHPRKNVALDR